MKKLVAKSSKDARDLVARPPKRSNKVGKVNDTSFERPQIPHQISQQQPESPSQLSQISFPLDVAQLNHQPIQKTAVTSYESPQQNQALPSFQYFKSYSNSKFFLLL